MSGIDKDAKTGILMKARAQSRARTIEGEAFLRNGPAPNRAAEGSGSAAFAGLFIFTLLLYARPNEMFPQLFGSFPLVRIVAIVTLAAYFFGRLTRGERLTIWPLELKMLALITLLGVVFLPIAASPGDTISVLLDTFLKVGVIFVLMINIISTRERLRALLKLVVVCGTVIALAGVGSYLAGNFVFKASGQGLRIGGLVGGLFGNPNDMATAFDMLIPLAVALALTTNGIGRLFYLACTAALAAGVVVTWSRGGFLGMITVGCVLLWKAGRENRLLTAAAFVAIVIIFFAAIPGGYAERITTIFNSEQDMTGSAQARRDLLERAVSVASNHLVIGVGMGNYHIYSIREQVAHNSYLEISAELGVAGLIAYLVLIFSAMRSMRRIERDTLQSRGGSLDFASIGGKKRESYHISVALQAALFGYLVCSAFGSIQYLWYLYYPVAYAVALRGIHAAERAVEGEQPIITLKARPKGVLWGPQQRSEAGSTYE